MVRRAHEPEQDITLTGETNKQDFPAKVTTDAADADNVRRVQAAKGADAAKLAKVSGPAPTDVVSLTSPAGTKVRASTAEAEGLKRAGFN